MGELIAGLLLGPSVLGHLFPSAFNYIFTGSVNGSVGFDGLSRLAIILFLFIAGMEVHFNDILKRGKAAAKISLMSILFPFAAGYFGTQLFYSRFFDAPAQSHFASAMFMGTALSITALSVLAKILIDLDLGRTRFGSLLLTSAMINDFAGWLLFAVVISLADMKHEGPGIWQTIVMVIVFTVVLLSIGRKLIDRLFGFVAQHFPGAGASLITAIFICLLGALFTEWVGIHAIFGAFLTGVAVGDSRQFSLKARETLHQFVTFLLAPLFFVSIGLRVDLVRDFDPVICAFILTVACLGKLIGGSIGAYLSGFKINKAFAVGFAMNARGSMEIVLGLLALQAKIINEKIFVGLVFMTFVTILIAGPALRYFLQRHERYLSVTQEGIG
jgi:Kef-type K+ transport system membrane component KefB